MATEVAGSDQPLTLSRGLESAASTMSTLSAVPTVVICAGIYSVREGQLLLPNFWRHFKTNPSSMSISLLKAQLIGTLLEGLFYGRSRPFGLRSRFFNIRDPQGYML